jgi:hypothetical protein
MQNPISQCINTQNEKIKRLLKSFDNNKKELGRRLSKMMTSTKPCTCKSKHGTKEVLNLNIITIFQQHKIK